jgi:cytochrome c553
MSSSHCTKLLLSTILFCATCAANTPTVHAQTAQASRENSGAPVPFWAYPVLPPGVAAPAAAPDDGKPQRLPGATAAFTLTQIADRFDIADWFPESHPPMPEVVSHGNKAAAVQACGFCHLPNGQGHPQNSSLAGLPAAYMTQQLADFKSGARKSSEPRFNAVTQMITIAKGLTNDETKAAVDYFASMKYKPWISVKESATAPKTISTGSMLLPSPTGGHEAIGDRLLELPVNAERTELRDPTSPFVVYAPTGSLEKGKSLVTAGAGVTIPCSTCHGADLHGMGNIPSIAGRSPSQMARQLVDFRSGARNGTGAQMMKPVAGKLTDGQIVAITAYLASLKP